jgi:hypothetical protein
MVHIPAMTGLKRAPDQPPNCARYGKLQLSMASKMRSSFFPRPLRGSAERNSDSPEATGLFCDLAGNGKNPGRVRFLPTIPYQFDSGSIITSVG